MGLLDGFFSLANRVNVLGGINENDKNDFAELPELELTMSDSELITLSREWENTWKNSDIFRTLVNKQKENEKYWKGEHYSEVGDERPLADNMIFEATETFLPVATKRNPEPVVESDNTPEGNKVAYTVQKMLQFQADRLRLKMRIQDAVRFWSLYFLGVGKVGWDKNTNDIIYKSIRPQKLILDPDGIVEGCEFTGEYLGEYRKEKAHSLAKRFPKKAEFITDYVKGKMGTTVQYIEWWTNDYVFWTLGTEVLAKSKNPHFNYPQDEKGVDEMGAETVSTTPGKNHFVMPKKPYMFISVYNLGISPVDVTNIIQQNISLQDLINKRLRQIDKNADQTNNSLVISGDNFTRDQAADVAEALRRGRAVWIPSGKPSDTVDRTVAPALPQYVYETLVDYRNELRNVYGTNGMSTQGIQNEETVRGKIMIKAQDVDRMGIILEHIEQFADEIYNWFTQLFYVYYDEVHTASVVGKEKTKEYIQLSNQDLTKKLTVGVKEGSMIPQDSLTKYNQAVDLLTANLLDPITAFEMMDFPNPKETAEKLMLWRTNPMALFQTPPTPEQAAAPVLPGEGQVPLAPQQVIQ